MDVPAAAAALGTLSAVCWSVQLIPQLVVNYRRHNATGLQPSMMMLWAWAGVPLGTYNIVSNFSIALQVQAQILAFLSLLTWAQVYYYEHKWSPGRCVATALPIGLIMGAIEFGLVVALKRGAERDIRWPTTLMAVLAALFLGLGVLRHYLDIYLHKTVRGISFTFCAIDALGDLTAILSVVFQPKLDVLGIVIYGVELILWCGIFACGGYFNLRSWIKTRTNRNAANAEIELRNESQRGEQNALGLHQENVSSTSVFRTAGRDDGVVRQRHGSVLVA